ncbi:MAG: protein kinase [Gemmatimonadetes bacterium]|nr:protein kinase [Gemmatimonadota bacterium]
MTENEQSQTPNGVGERAFSLAPGADARDAMICPACGAEYAADTRFCPNDGSTLRPIGNTGGELVGSVIDDRYYLVEKLGAGGMGDVYLGEHVRTRRRCAVKIVSRAFARDPEALGRFMREATNAGRISHPHVATVYDIGETGDGLLYLAMEYVDGESLAKLLEREGALIPARAVDIARQVAEAVGAAHELDIIHRDLKPSNIMVARDRKGGDLVKVVDFGIARATSDEQQRLTRTGLVIGTPEYMSPEQLIGDPVDARSDVYSLGCILYEMLTGNHAFGGSTAQVITRRLTESPPRPREKNPAIPKPLDDVIVAALGRLPAERYKTMDALRDALLAAPTQPVITGPGRIATWLGLKSSKEERPTDTVERDLAATTAGRAPNGGALPAPVSDPTPIPILTPPPFSTDAPAEVQPEEPAPSEPATPLHAFSIPIEEPVEAFTDTGVSGEREDPGLFGEGGELGSVAEDSLASPVPESEPLPYASGAWEPLSREQEALPSEGDPPHRARMLPRLALGAVVVLVLAVGTFALRGLAGDRSAAAPVVTDPTPAGPIVADPAGADPGPPVVSRPDDGQLAELRAELSLAAQETPSSLAEAARGDSLQFVAAIRRLRSVEARLAELSAAYPGIEEIQSLADSTQAQLSTVEKLCTSWRDVAILRNRPPPVCRVE